MLSVFGGYQEVLVGFESFEMYLYPMLVTDDFTLSMSPFVYGTTMWMFFLFGSSGLFLLLEGLFSMFFFSIH